MSKNNPSATRRFWKRIKRGLSRRRHSVPQVSTLQESQQGILAQLPGSSSGAVGPGNSTVGGGQPQDHDATAVEEHCVVDEDRPTSSGINSSSNPGLNAESPWRVALMGLSPNHQRALAGIDFRNQNPTDTFEKEIGRIRGLSNQYGQGKLVNILKKMDKYAKIGDLAMQHHPEIVALIWAALRMSLQVTLNDLTTFERLGPVFEDVTAAVLICRSYEDLYSQKPLKMFSAAKAVLDGLSPMYRACLRLLAETIIYSAEKTPKRLGKSIIEPFETRFKPLIEDINQRRSLLETYIHGVEHETLAKVSEDIDRRERGKALKRISTVEYTSHHSDVKRSRVPDTGDWLLRDIRFTFWRDCKRSSLLWLHGKAGSGKTVLSSSVIDALTTDYASTPTIYFYCKYNEQPRAQAFSIIRSLLRQLSVASQTFSPEILSAFSSTDKAPLAFSDIERLFTVAMSQIEKAFIIIDALDECLESERAELISFLRKLLALNSCQVKIFLTSRPEGHRKLSRGQQTWAIGVSDTIQDIRSFVARTVEDLISREALLSGHVTSEFKDDLITALTKEADGVFLWARYQLEAIRELGNEEDIQEQLGQLPKGLEETYMHIWRRIQGFPKATSSRAYKTLKWILSATRPLNSDEIITALAIKPLDSKFQAQQKVSLKHLLSACGDLVYEDNKGHLRFVHASVQEFLMQQPELKDAEGFVADICFTALAFPQQPPIAIWDYAARNWVRHARCWQEINDDRSTLIERFLLTARLEEWAEYLSKLLVLSSFDRATPPPPPLPASRYGAIGVCASFNVPIILDHLLQRNTGHSEEDFSELVSAGLLLAAAGGHTDAARLLINAGANTRWRMLYRRSTLELNWRTGYGVGARVPETSFRPESRYSATALQMAAGSGHTEVVKLLLNNDADVNDRGCFFVPRDQWGGDTVPCETALQAACVNGSRALEIVRLLVRRGATINTRGEGCGTPLQAAAAGGHGGAVGFLLEHGAKAEIQYRIDISIVRAGRMSCKTALQAACISGDEKAVRLLFKATADPLGWEHGTPLQLAAASGRGGAVAELLKAGADANVQNIFKFDSGRRLGKVYCKTALQAACVSGSEEAIDLLIKTGADGLGWEYGTPLQLAAASGCGGAVALLLKAGADVNVRNSFRLWGGGLTESFLRGIEADEYFESEVGELCHTALQAALAAGSTAVAQQLRDAGAS